MILFRWMRQRGQNRAFLIFKHQTTLKRKPSTQAACHSPYHSRQLLETGTARPIDFYLLNYEATGDPNMRPGRVVGLFSSSDDPDRIAAARLIARTTSLSIGAEKRGVDQTVGDQSLEVDAGSLENASSLCAALRELGFSASQLPEPAV